MKKIIYALALTGAVGFTSCDSPAEERAEEQEDRVEEMEDRAEERADELEDMEEDTDTTAVINEM